MENKTDKKIFGSKPAEFIKFMITIFCATVLSFALMYIHKHIERTKIENAEKTEERLQKNKEIIEYYIDQDSEK